MCVNEIYTEKPCLEKLHKKEVGSARLPNNKSAYKTQRYLLLFILLHLCYFHVSAHKHRCTRVEVRGQRVRVGFLLLFFLKDLFYFVFYLCVYICVYVCVRIYVCVCIYVCMCVCVHTWGSTGSPRAAVPGSCKSSGVGAGN